MNKQYSPRSDAAQNAASDQRLHCFGSHLARYTATGSTMNEFFLGQV